MVLGLTGCPGSGKSILAAELVRHGWILVDADEIGRELVGANGRSPVLHDHAVLNELARVFGDDILEPDGRLQRRVLGKRAFGEPDKIRMLNDIVHPPLISRLKDRIRALRSSGNHVVVDCALIFEWEIQNIFDKVVCVAAEEHIRKERIIQRDGRSAEEVDDIFAAQLPEIEKVRRADIVVKNNNSIDSMIIFGKMFANLPGYQVKIK